MIGNGYYVGGYRVDGFLGKGGMAEVYRVWHEALERHEALKVLPAHLCHDPSFVRRFMTEARTAARLHHHHIAAIHGVSDGRQPPYFFTMELVQGQTLASWMSERTPLALDDALPVLRQIADALDYAHARGVVHRDVKPSNVLLAPEGSSGWSVKVVDFGIARAAETMPGTRYTQTGEFLGTPEYMSPEQSGSGVPIDHRTDIYSLGIIAYEMLCGMPPFPADRQTPPLAIMNRQVRETPRSPRELDPQIQLQVSNAILRALAKNPAQRFASCREFMDALCGHRKVRPPLDAPRGVNNRSLLAASTVLMLAGGILLISSGMMRQPRHFGSIRTSDAKAVVMDGSGGENEERAGDSSIAEPTPTPVPTPTPLPVVSTLRYDVLSNSTFTGIWGTMGQSTLTLGPAAWDGSYGTYSGTIRSETGSNASVEVRFDPASNQIFINELSGFGVKGTPSQSSGTLTSDGTTMTGNGTSYSQNSEKAVEFGWELYRQ